MNNRVEFIFICLLVSNGLFAFDHNHSGALDFTPEGTQPKLTFPLEGVADCQVYHATQNPNAVENAMCNRVWNEGPANKSRGQFMYEQWLANGRSAPVIMVHDEFVIVNRKQL